MVKRNLISILVLQSVIARLGFIKYQKMQTGMAIIVKKLECASFVPNEWDLTDIYS